MYDSEIRARLNYLVQNSASLSTVTRQEKKEELMSGIYGPNHHEILFPVKLHKLVSCKALFPNIFWLDNYTFVVNRKGFEKNVMNVFFRQCKFKSFLSMLSRYGFKSCSSTKKIIIPTGDLIAYGHPLFQSDHEELCQNITVFDHATCETEVGPPYKIHHRVVDVSLLEQPGIGNNDNIYSSAFSDQDSSCHQVQELLRELDTTNSIDHDDILATTPKEDIITNAKWNPPFSGVFVIRNKIQGSMDDSEIRAGLDYLVQNNASLSNAARRKRKEELMSCVYGPNHHEFLFPVKLHKLVSCKALFPNIFWLDNYTFVVNRKGFEKNVMNVFFRQCKFKSFLSMLSRYGFKSCSSTKKIIIPTGDLIAYGHPLIQSDHEKLCQNITVFDHATCETEVGPPYKIHHRVVDVSLLEQPGIGNNDNIYSSAFSDQDSSCHQVQELLRELDNTNSIDQDDIHMSKPYEDIITNGR